MKVLITGGTGMLGRTLARHLTDHEVRSPGSRELDISDVHGVDAAMAAFRPQVIVHCGAMTQVDACETEQDKAYRINAVGSGIVAAACAKYAARLIAISTDYVFPGDLDRPYHEWDVTGARTVYGASKWHGEEAIRRHCPDHLIARVAWLYGPGGPSFVHTMLRLGALAGPALKVVDDQLGNPTSTDAVAEAVVELLDVPLTGTMHLTCSGEASWYGFTQAIRTATGSTRELLPCTTAEYPRPAPRPANSRLDNRLRRLAGLRPMPHWQDALQRFLREHPNR